MKICCSSPMVPGDSLTKKAELLSGWGYDAIAVFQPLEDWSEEVGRELSSLEERTGVRPVEFVLIDDIYGNAMAANADLRRRCRDMYKAAAQVCASIGAVTEIEYQYGPQNPMPLFEPYQQLDGEQHEGFVTFYREMLDSVRGSDAKILLEPLNRYESRYLNSVQDNLAILTEVDHPNAGLLPDTFHMSIEEESIGRAFLAAGDQVKHVHLGDSNRLLPGRGLLDWQDVFASLKTIGFQGYVNLECSTSGDPSVTLPAAAGWLKERCA